MTLGDADFRKSPYEMIYRKFPKTASLPVTCHPLRTYEISTSMLRRRNPRLSVIGQKIGSCIQKIGFTSPPQKSYTNITPSYLATWILSGGCMKLRTHPLMSYRGVSNWLPVWVGTNRRHEPLKVEVGVLNACRF